MSYIDIIIPVKNESDNLSELASRIDKTMHEAKINYCMFFVNDYSTDNSAETIKKLSKIYPIKLLQKQGKPGKAFCILEAIPKTTSEYLVMIDADLQYPPEVIPEMLKLATDNGIVLANRKTTHTSYIRKIGSKINALLFGKLLLGINGDIQSGLKLFKREIIKHIDISLISPWTFDVPLVYTALELGYKIGSLNITFNKRKNGKSKVHFLKTAYEIGTKAFKIKLQRKKIYYIGPDNNNSMVGAGVAFKRKRYITHTTLPHSKSALITFKNWQILIISLFLSVIILGLTINPILTALIIVGILSTIYFIDVLFNLFLIIKSLHFPPEIIISQDEIDNHENIKLPVYSILCPLYKEVHVLPQFLEGIKNINWPKNKLDVLLLLEEDDKETIDKIKGLNIPNYGKGNYCTKFTTKN